MTPAEEALAKIAANRAASTSGATGNSQTPNSPDESKEQSKVEAGEKPASDPGTGPAAVIGAASSNAIAGAAAQVQQRPLTSAELRALADKQDDAAKKAAEDYKRQQQGPGYIFHCRIPNSRFIVQKMKIDEFGRKVPLVGQATILQFHGDSLYTEDAEAILQLSEIADQPGCPIYIDPANAKPTAAEVAAFAEVKQQAGDSVTKMAQAGQRA